MERQERRFEAAGRSRDVLVQWNTHEGDFLVNFLHPRSRLPLTHRRQFKDWQTLADLIDRSLTPLGNGPRGRSIRIALEAGRGETTIHVSEEQYARLTAKRPHARP